MSLSRALLEHVTAQSSVDAVEHGLTTLKAVVLGVVEGVTEYLPISSTGHLTVTAEILDIGRSDAAKDAIDSYNIAIQLGAILAVLFLYQHRLRDMALGVVGRSESGRRVLVAVATAFVPAAVVGVTLEREIKDRLFGSWPVVIAWAVGGVAILAFTRWRPDAGRAGVALDAITLRHALWIGAAQILALWPGTSRSMVTIIAALLVGLAMRDAVEFSFLLGFVTLTAATLYEIVTNGSQMIDVFGWFDPLVGLLAAFVSAVVAVRWMVGYLNRHSLAIFGWYRLGIAALVASLLAGGIISS